MTSVAPSSEPPRYRWTVLAIGAASTAAMAAGLPEDFHHFNQRRYKRGLQNLFNIIPLMDHWAIWDNSEGPASIIAQGNQNLAIDVYKNDIWDIIKVYESGRH